MRRAPAGPDLGVYARAVALLVRNPSIIIIPLVMAVAGLALGMVFGALGAGGGTTGGLVGFIARVLEFFGLGAACIIADDAWRHGRASFERGWSEAQRRGGDLLFAALGVAFVVSLASFVGVVLGAIVALVVEALALVFLIWTMPAAAVGGVPGGAAMNVSVERVRENPIPAVVAGIVTALLLLFVVPYVDDALLLAVAPYTGGSVIVAELLGALVHAIFVGYIALFITKTYADAAFGRRY
ncbi:MAG TPA: hypothetical protein VGN14_06540 [Candidatus Elarobacter sp.]